MTYASFLLFAAIGCGGAKKKVSTSTATEVAASLPTADSIFSQHDKAVGTIEDITVVHQKGTVSLAMGVSGPVESWFVKGVGFTNTMDLTGIGKVMQGYDTKVAWSSDGMRGPRVLSGGELQKLKVEYENAFNITIASQYLNASTVGVADRAGQSTYKVTATKKGDDNPSTLYFSKESGLLVGTDEIVVAGAGKQTIRTDVVEYKDFGGLKMPAKLVSKAAGQELNMSYTIYEFNVEAPAIVPPDEIKALLAEEAENESSEPTSPVKKEGEEAPKESDSK